MPDADLIAIRMRLTGGKQVAAETDKVTASQKRLRDEQGRFIKTSKDSTKANEEQVKATSAATRKRASMMQATGRTLTYGVTAPLALAGAMAVKTAASFDKSMAQVKTATNLGGAGMQQMEALALKWGAETIFSANDSAEAILELTKSGIDPAEVKAGALGATMNLAATEGLELGRTAEIVGAAMNTFGLKATEADRISDALAGGALASSASVGGLAQSLSQGGQSAAMYGLSVEESVGALAAFAQNGIQASDAGTSFKTFLMRLNPTTKKAKEEMARLNLDFFDSQGKMKGLGGVATELRQHMSGMSDEARGAAFNVLFGSDAIRAANIVYKEGPAGIERYIRATEKKGSADKMAQAQMQGLNGAIENLKGSLETAAVHLGHALAPAVETVATAVGGLADQFAALPPDVQSTIAVVGTLAALAGPVLWFAGSMAKAVIAIRDLRTAEAVGGGGGLLGGKGKGMMGRLGVAGLGLGAAQIGGDAIGGDLGGMVSNVGTGAAAGFALGGPMGAAVGATAGGVYTAVQKLTSGEKALTLQQQRLSDSSKELGEWWQRQRQASRGLVAADQRVSSAQHRQAQSTRAMKEARAHLGAVVSEYGAQSRPAIHAEARLTGLVNKHRRAVRALQNAERLRGVALSAYKTETNSTVLAERHRVNVLSQLRDKQARLFSQAKAANPQSAETARLAHNLLGTEGKLAQAHQRQSQTLADAAAKGGAKYATFLRTANQESVRAGGAIKALNLKAEALNATFERLATAPSLPEAPSIKPTVPKKLRVPHGANGFSDFGGGLAVVGEDGPELLHLPRHSNLTPAPATRRLLGSAGDPQPSSRLATMRHSNGGTRLLQPIVVKIGKRAVAETTAEIREDDEARL